MKHGFIILALIVSFGTFYAQETPAPTNSGQTQTSQKQYTHYFGLGAGIISGVGLSYRYWPAPWGVQVNFIPVANQGNIYASIGLLGLYLINDAKWSRFFLYLGSSYTYTKSINEGQTLFENNLAYLGGGIGMELILFDNFGIDLMGGLEADYSSRTSFGTGLSIDGGIYYRL